MALLERLRQALGNSSVPVAMPEWCEPKVSEVEELIEIRQRDESSSWAGYIRYVDATGEGSSRRIICRRVEGYGAVETVAAYCCERKQPRRFRIDRIQELVCLDTGEVLDPQQHFEQLRLFGALQIVDKSLNDFARMLVFMARCDGSVHPLEVDAIDEALGRYVLRFGGDDRMLEQAQRNAGRLAPDGEDFVDSLSRIDRHPHAPEVARLLRDSVNSVSYADHRIHEDEQIWTQVVVDALDTMRQGSRISS